MKKQVGLAILVLSLIVPSAFASDKFEVTVGNSKVIGPVQDMATVIVGDDSVVDATVGGGGTIILTGKVMGTTNLIVLDELGGELIASTLYVVPVDRRPTTTVRVLNGASDAQNYVCGPTPACSPVEGTPVASNVPAADKLEQGATPETPEAGDAPASEEQVSLKP